MQRANATIETKSLDFALWEDELSRPDVDAMAGDPSSVAARIKLRADLKESGFDEQAVRELGEAWLARPEVKSYFERADVQEWMAGQVQDLLATTDLDLEAIVSLLAREQAKLISNSPLGHFANYPPDLQELIEAGSWPTDAMQLISSKIPLYLHNSPEAQRAFAWAGAMDGYTRALQRAFEQSLGGAPSSGHTNAGGHATVGMDSAGGQTAHKKSPYDEATERSLEETLREYDRRIAAKIADKLFAFGLATAVVMDATDVFTPDEPPMPIFGLVLGNQH